MARIGPADEGDLDPRAKEILDGLHGEWGRPWNISRGLANNPAILDVFIALQAGLEKGGLIPTVLDIDPFHGAHRPAGQARRAARCGTPDSEMAGKRRNAPGGPMCPTRRAGRFLSPAASRVACGGWHRGATRS